MKTNVALSWPVATGGAATNTTSIRDPDGLREALGLLLTEFAAGLAPLADEEASRHRVDEALAKAGRGALGHGRAWG